MALRERVHVVWSIVAGWSFTFLFCAVVIVSATLTLGRCWRWMTPVQARFWSRVLLGIQRVKVEYEGLEHLETPAMRVATFNHTSSLDPMLITSMYRRASTSAIKREVLYIPLVGLAIKLMGFLLIDRKRAGKGQGTLAAAAERMEREKMTVFIAPEGTRSPDGALQPFKSGALRLAMASGAPIVPVVIEGAFELWPRDRWAAMPGVVRIRILPPISTEGLNEETLRPFSERLREIYVEALGR